MPERRTTPELIRFHPQELNRITEHADVPSGWPRWLAGFLDEASRETDALRENGGEQAAAARTALLRTLVGAAQTYLDAELDAAEAARETGRCAETIRRAVREGAIPDRRANPRGRHKIRRGDLHKLAAPDARPYDPTADAQRIAQLRRKL
jgi:hypothetical protein